MLRPESNDSGNLTPEAMLGDHATNGNIPQPTAKINPSAKNSSRRDALPEDVEYMIPVTDLYDAVWNGVNRKIVYAKGSIDAPITSIWTLSGNAIYPLVSSPGNRNALAAGIISIAASLLSALTIISLWLSFFQ